MSFEEWAEQELDKLDLNGRDAFHTHLICQEIPMWLAQIREGQPVANEEVDFLIRRRGFNAAEAQKLRTLADWMNAHRAEILDHERREVDRLG